MKLAYLQSQADAETARLEPVTVWRIRCIVAVVAVKLRSFDVGFELNRLCLGSGSVCCSGQEIIVRDGLTWDLIKKPGGTWKWG